MKKVKCPRCEHEWETKSELVNVTCSSCGYKIPNKEDDKNGSNNS